jgi:hypothetical protein
LQFYDGVAVIGMVGGRIDLPAKIPRRSHRFVLGNKKGKREGGLRRILERELVTPPPEDLLQFLADMAENYREPDSQT